MAKIMRHRMFEKKDYHGWTEDKAWAIGDDSHAIIEFDDGDTMEFGDYYEATDYLYDMGYN